MTAAMEGDSVTRPRFFLPTTTDCCGRHLRPLEPECEVVGAVGMVEHCLPRLSPPADIVVWMSRCRCSTAWTPPGNFISPCRSEDHLLTVSEDPDIAAEAFRVGAAGFLLKNSAASELILAIREVTRAARMLPLSHSGAGQQFNASSRPKAKSADSAPANVKSSNSWPKGTR